MITTSTHNLMFSLPDVAKALYSTTGITAALHDLRADQVSVLTPSDLEYETIFRFSRGPLRKHWDGRKEYWSQIVFNEINCGWAVIHPKPQPGASRICLEKNTSLILGPIFLGALKEETVRSYYSRNGLTIEESKMAARACRRIPIVSLDVLIQQYDFLHLLINGELPPRTFAITETSGEETEDLLSSVPNDDSRPEESTASISEGDDPSQESPVPGANDRSKRSTAPSSKYDTGVVHVPRNEEDFYDAQQRNFQVSRQSEAYLLDCIRRGDVERLRGSDQSALKELSELGSTPIRSLKNNLITAVTLMTRAAMESGVPVEIAFPLSDLYILGIEEGENLAEIVRVFRASQTDFATRVRNAQYREGLSTLVRGSCSYIEVNMEKPLNLASVAAAMEVSPDYLSRRFRREMGKSVNDFIREKKVEEAVFRIRHTDKPLTEIAYELGYNSQGKFIEDIKKQTGRLPRQFRKE